MWKRIGPRSEKLLGEIGVPRLDNTARQNFGDVSIGEAISGDKSCQPVTCSRSMSREWNWQGAVETIRRLASIIYAENDRKEKSAELIEFLFQPNYRCYFHASPLRAISQLSQQRRQPISQDRVGQHVMRSAQAPL